MWSIIARKSKANVSTGVAVLRQFSKSTEELFPAYLSSNELIVAVLGTNEQSTQTYKVLPQMKEIFPGSHVFDGVGSDGHSAIKEAAYSYVPNKLQGLLFGRGTNSNTRKAINQLSLGIITLSENYSGDMGQLRIRIFLMAMSRGCITAHELMQHFAQDEINIESKGKAYQLKPQNFELIVNLIDPVKGPYFGYWFSRWMVPDNVIDLSVYYALLERRLFFGHSHLIVNTDVTNVTMHYFLGAHSDLHGRDPSPESTLSRLISWVLMKLICGMGYSGECVEFDDFLYDLDNDKLPDVSPAHAKYLRISLLKKTLKYGGGVKSLSNSMARVTRGKSPQQYVEEIVCSGLDFHWRQGRGERAHAFVSFMFTKVGLSLLTNRQFQTIDRAAKAAPSSDSSWTHSITSCLGNVFNSHTLRYRAYKTLEQQIDEVAARRGENFSESMYEAQKVAFFQADNEVLPKVLRAESQKIKHGHFETFFEVGLEPDYISHPAPVETDKNTKSLS